MKRILLLILTLLFIQSLFCVPDNYREALAIVIRDLSDYIPTGSILDDGRTAGQVIHSTIEDTEPPSHIVDLARQVYSDMIIYYGTTETVTGDIWTDEITALSIALSQYGIVATGSRIDDRNTLFDLIIAEGVALAPKFYDLDQWLPAQYTYAIDLDGLVEDLKADYDAYNVGLGGSSTGTGKLTFSDLTGVTISSYLGTATPTKSGNDIDIPAGTLYDLKLSDGTYIPNPYTGYDVSASGNHASVSGLTQTDIKYYAYCQKYGFNQYLKNITAGVASIASDMAYGVWEHDVIRTAPGQPRYYFISDSIDPPVGSGYGFEFKNSGRVLLWKSTGGSEAYLFYLDVGMDADTLYRIKVVRNLTTDQYVTGAIGTFAVYIRGGNYGNDYILMPVTVGSNPKTDNTHTTSSYLYNNFDAGDIVGNGQLTDVDGNVRYLPNEVSEWNVSSGAYETHTVPGLADASNIDALNNACRYEAATGIMPSGKTEFNPTDIADTELEPYNLKATISNVLGLPEYWKDEVLSETTVYDPTESFRHENKYFSFEYLHALGTRKLIRKLFLKDYDNDLHYANQQILNYGTAKTDAELYRIYRFYKMLGHDVYNKYYGYWDESNNKFDVGFQDLWCIAGYDFVNKYSMFADDDQFAILDEVVDQILDVGSGGADSISYFDITQATTEKQATRTQYGLLSDGVDDTYTVGDIDSVKAIVWKAKYSTFTEELLTLGTGKQLVLQDTVYKYAGDYIGYSIYGAPPTSEFTVNAIVFNEKQDGDAVKLFTDGTGFGNIEMEYIKFFNDFDPIYIIREDSEIIPDSEIAKDIETLY